MKCTVPAVFGFKKWFNDRFENACVEHDNAYVLRVWSKKVAADYAITAEIIDRGYFWLGVACFIYCSTLGTLFWGWKKING